MDTSRDNNRWMVLKFGTDVLRDGDSNRVDDDVFYHICKKASKLYRAGINPLIVSSGAMLVGMEEDGLDEVPLADDVTEKQSLSGVGQAGLISIFRGYFRRQNLKTQQVLVTHRDLKDDIYRNNMVDVVRHGYKKGRIAVFNENDIISPEEFKEEFKDNKNYFGDNDGLAYLVARDFGAEACFFFNTGGGLFDDSGNLVSVARVNHLDKLYYMVEGRKGSNGGRGGVQSKVGYCSQCARNGTIGVMANGNYITQKDFDVMELLSPEKAYDRTLFLPREK